MATPRSLLGRMAPLLRRRIELNHRLLTSSSAAAEPLPSGGAAAEADAVHMTENCVRVPDSNLEETLEESDGFDELHPRLKELRSKDSSVDAKMLRLSVETGGCSGFQYVFLLDDKKNEDDRVFDKDGVKLVVDNISYDFVKGATVDYVEELIRSAFLVVTNPSAVGGCSCKSSFMVK